MLGNTRRVAIVCGIRTPFIRAGTLFRDLSSLDLGRIVTVELINRSEVDPEDIDEVVFGSMVSVARTPNLARDIALASGIGASTPAYTVTMSCISGIRAFTSALESIALGNRDTVLVGGVESFSECASSLSSKMFNIKLKNGSFKTVGLLQRVNAFLGNGSYKLSFGLPFLLDASAGITLGESAEKMARKHSITRREQDEFAARSHNLASISAKDGRFGEEIVSLLLPPDFSTLVCSDNGVCKDISVEALSKEEPIFDRRYGTVTFGNSSYLSDGASAVLLMAEEKARALGYNPLGYVRAYAYASASVCTDEKLLMGPAYSTPIALELAELTLREIDLVEIQETFAAQVLSNARAFASKKFAKEDLNRSNPVGEIELERLNVLGGSIAIGHPFGASGLGVIVTLLNELKRRDRNFGLVCMSASGGLGVSIILERE
ncbi:3-ketoacyl-CoA thiolase [bacterium HR37]|nr:3-ketoacyl-CoA thiolase [bacterium HR37]